MSGAENLLLDTNLLVYAHDRNEPVKGSHARAVLAQILLAGKPLLSTQVLSEFYWNVTRKLRQPLNHAEALAEVNRLAGLTQIVPLTLARISHRTKEPDRSLDCNWM
jgi:predicted nucleic acid-binding protein